MEAKYIGSFSLTCRSKLVMQVAKGSNDVVTHNARHLIVVCNMALLGKSF